MPAVKTKPKKKMPCCQSMAKLLKAPPATAAASYERERLADGIEELGRMLKTLHAEAEALGFYNVAAAMQRHADAPIVAGLVRAGNQTTTVTDAVQDARARKINATARRRIARKE